MSKHSAAWLIVVIMALAGCHGQGPVGEVQLSGDFSIRLVGSSGGDAAARGDWRAAGHAVEVYAHDAGLAGFELSYDPAALCVASIERGDYFGPADLYLTVDSRPGLAAVGGYRFDPQLVFAEPVLVARVIFAAGAAGHAVSVLPTGDNARPRAFELTDAGDGTAALSWWHHNTGDYNQDGEVGLGDITPVGVHFNSGAGDADWDEAYLADGDNNGLVLASDLTPIGANFLTRISGYTIEQGTSADGPFTQVADVPLSAGTAAPRLAFSQTLAAPQDGAYYRVRSYSSEDSTQGAATPALRFDMLPAGSNPVAVAQADQTSGPAPLAVGFSDGGSSDSDGTIQLWEWDFDHDMAYEYDASSTGGLASHTYTQSGTYYARLKVTDNDGRSATDVVMISVGTGGTTGDPPTAYAYCLPNQGWAPLTVYFSPFGSTAAGTGSITKYEWDLDGDGQYETDATTDSGYAQYTYAAAGTYTPRLRLTESAGLTATAAVSVSVRDLAASSVDYATIFDDSQVRPVLIDIDQADWDAMWVTPEAKVEVECQATVFSEQFSDVQISMRGHRSLWDVPEKKPWQLDFNDIDDTQEYHNLKQLLFNNFYQDPSLVREKLGYDMLAFAGVSASHVCYVDFWIDVHGDGAPAVFYGVYSMVERVDKKFLENRYGADNDDGNLYKASAWEEGAATLAYLGPAITDYPLPHGDDYCYGKRTNEEEADYSDVINLCYVIDAVEYATPDAFAAALEQVFNVDSFLRYLACVISCSNLDIYIYTGNNYYLYNNPATGKFEWIPWDVNDSWGLFLDTEMNKNQPLYELGEMPLTRRVMEVQKYRRAYAAYIDLLRRHWFTYQHVRTQAQGIHDLISPHVKQDSGDKMFYGGSAMFPIEAFDANWDTNWTQEPGINVLGVASLTQLRCDFIDQHLLADLGE
ncbi:CotH kinase family protein [bacterium]|nr:CotH kinase family protein [bacterium]